MFTTQFKVLILVLLVVGILGLVVTSQVVVNKRLNVVQERLDVLTTVTRVPTIVSTPAPTATPTAALKVSPGRYVVTPTVSVK